MRLKRHLLGIVVAPVAAPIVFTIVLSARYLVTEGWADFFDTFFLIMSFGMPIAYVVTIFFGLPLFKLLQKLGWVNFWSVTVGAGVIAVLPFLLLYISNADVFPPGIKDAKALGLIFVCGFTVGLLYWVLALSSRRTAENKR